MVVPLRVGHGIYTKIYDNTLYYCNVFNSFNNKISFETYCFQCSVPSSSMFTE